MSRQRLIISGLAITVVVVCSLAYWQFSAIGISAPMVSVPRPSADVVDKNTVAYSWQWKNFSDNQDAENNVGRESTNSAAVEELPYDVVRIYELLKTVHLDEQGNVVVDQTANDALKRAFSELGPDVGWFGIRKLQDLIRLGLPGKAGEQAATAARLSCP